MPRRYYIAQTNTIAVASGSTLYPLVVTAGAVSRIVEIKFDFDGSSSTDDQIKCELVKVASVTGGTSLTPVSVDDGYTEASATSAVYTATSVGTENKAAWRGFIHPQGSPPYRPGVTMAAGSIWALKITTGTQGHNGLFRVVFEE